MEADPTGPNPNGGQQTVVAATTIVSSSAAEDTHYFACLAPNFHPLLNQNRIQHLDQSSQWLVPIDSGTVWLLYGRQPTAQTARRLASSWRAQPKTTRRPPHATQDTYLFTFSRVILFRLLKLQMYNQQKR